MTLKIALAVFIGTIVLVVAFAFFVPRASRLAEEKALLPEPTVAPLVALADAYSKGVHTISGSVLAPTPCTTLSAEVAVASGTPARLSVTLLMPPDTGVCLQEETTLSFKVAVSAPEDAIIEAFVNGVRASTTDALP